MKNKTFHKFFWLEVLLNKVVGCLGNVYGDIIFLINIDIYCRCWWKSKTKFKCAYGLIQYGVMELESKQRVFSVQQSLVSPV